MAAKRLTLLDEMARNPLNDWDISDIETVCRENGVNCFPPRGGGSHYKVSGAGVVLTIPATRRIKPVYIRTFVGLIRKIRDRRT